MLKGKVAVVTGSTSGIGLATAKCLAANGADIALHGLLDEVQGSELVEEFRREYGVGCIFSGADLKDPSQIEQFIQRVVSELGSVDVLVNNAGIQHTESVDTFPTDKWNDIIAINLSSAFHTIQKSLPVMKQQQWGRIINIASVHGLVGSINKSAYCASKHGIVGLTKVTALEVAEFGITVNSICPGWVDTPILSAQVEEYANRNNLEIKDAKRQIVTTKQPVPEMMSPSQIGEFIVFLCSDSARTISGSALPIDGAWTAQ